MRDDAHMVGFDRYLTVLYSPHPHYPSHCLVNRTDASSGGILQTGESEIGLEIGVRRSELDWMDRGF